MLGKLCLAVIAFPALIVMAAPAFAETVEFAGGPVYGGLAVQKPDSSFAGFVTCRLFNNGATAHITARKIFDNTDSAAVLTGDSCGGALHAHKSCSFATKITGNLSYTCSFTASPATASIVGVAEMMDFNFNIVNVVPISR